MSGTGRPGTSPEVVDRPDHRVSEPPMFRVVLHNDHYTTQEFVVEVLVLVFHKPVPEAVRIMFDVHRTGRGTVGLYTYDIAQTKATEVRRMAREREFPLRCSVEPA